MCLAEAVLVVVVLLGVATVLAVPAVLGTTMIVMGIRGVHRTITDNRIFREANRR